MRHVISKALLAVGLAACSSQEHADAGRAPLPVVEGVPELVDENPDPNVVEVRLEATATTVDIDGKQVAMLGYNGLVPGPMLKARAGDEVIVHFHNALTTSTTVHWHGLRISDAMDGSPRVQAPVEPGADFTYRFKIPESGSYWYHPHVRANEQVEAGLYAPIVVWDDADPTYDAERPARLDRYEAACALHPRAPRAHARTPR
jgi:FtsP/CotA-like multicopper oxidase with cupredoxin domain